MSKWVVKLAPQWIGKAQQAYTALNAENFTDFDKVKEAIMSRYNTTTFVCLLPAAQISSSVDASHALLLSSRVTKP